MTWIVLWQAVVIIAWVVWELTGIEKRLAKLERGADSTTKETE